MSSSKFSARFVPAGHMFDAKGPMGFAADHIDLLAVLAVLNSNSTDRFLSMLAPNLDFKLGHVLNLPLPASVDVRERLAAVASEAVGIAKALWDSAELSLEFEDHPLVVRGAGRLEEHLARVNHARDESAAQLRDFRASVDNILDSKGQMLSVPVKTTRTSSMRCPRPSMFAAWFHILSVACSVGTALMNRA